MEREDTSHSKSASCNNHNYNHMIHAVLLKYPFNGVTKTGIAKIHLGFDMDNEELEYRGIEYSDYELQEFLENSPSVLTKIHSIQSKLSPNKLINSQ